MEETKKDVLESTVEDQTLESMKQYEKHLENEKQKIIDIAYNQGYILYKFKESEELVKTVTLVKRLKMCKSTITLKVNLYTLVKNSLH